MAKNEPLSFGKPLLILVLAGVGYGGWYAYKHWPTTADGQGWTANFPPRWTLSQVDGRTVAKGALDETTQGAGWVSVTPHGAVQWPDMLLATLLPAVPVSHKTVEIYIHKALQTTYDDGDHRYMAIVVDRGDAFVTFVVGCPRTAFPKFEKLFEKCIRSVRCER
jgi:hypothetical protein